MAQKPASKANLGERKLTQILTMWGDSHVDVTLSWKNMSVLSTLDTSKVLLNNLTGSLDTGFTALMGPSGAGKSTLLNALALRLNSAKVEGKCTINGESYTSADLKRIGGYVLQDDILSEALTVEETLAYAARLRLPSDWNAQRRKARVNEVIEDMGLSRSRHTIIGSALRKGISGGERKRVSVGLELLTSPRIVFLDEPTSGLDSTTALSLCTLLRGISERKKCTVIATLHQPSAKIYNTFTSLLLLSAGQIVYHGSPEGSMAFFAARGFACPPDENPADFFMDVIADKDNIARILADTKPQEDALALAKGEDSIKTDDVEFGAVSARSGSAALNTMVRSRASWITQFLVLMHRSGKEAARGWRTILVQLTVSTLLGLLLGGYTGNAGIYLERGLQERVRILFFAANTQGVFGATGVINSFPADRVLSLKERASGMYTASPYYLSKALVATVQFFIGPIAFTLASYFLNGLQLTASKFFIYLGLLILTQVSTTALALAIAALCRTANLAVVVLPLCFEASRLCSGFYRLPATQSAAWVWIDYLSYLYYSYAALLQNELSGLTLYCTEAQLAVTNGVCPNSDPYQSYAVKNGYTQRTIGENAACLVLYTVVCHIIAYLGVRFLKR